MNSYYQYILRSLGLYLITCFLISCTPKEEVAIETYQKWDKITLDFEGPELSESGQDNPFMDYRLAVTFKNGNNSFTVPGYFAADGNAGESSAEKGKIWRVHFVPGLLGDWSYQVSFKKGKDIAIDDNLSSGEAGSFDGKSGKFKVIDRSENDNSFRAKGLLQFVNEHYLQFAETGERFLKGGADSPENFLAYSDFDGTYSYDTAKNFIKTWEPHVKDWKTGDPSWKGGKGKGMIGALNYLASEGVNSVYFLTMNIGGDGRDVWPYTSHEERFRFDCSKLDQWETVFTHMDDLGLMLHVVLQETENEMLLDNGDTGKERMAYFREIVARFGHHLMITWNLGEENGINNGNPTGQSDQQRMDMGNYIHQIDIYKRPVVVHTWSNNEDRMKIYTPLLGNKAIDGPSGQFGRMDEINEEMAYWREESVKAGKAWYVSMDEIGPAGRGVDNDERTEDNNQDSVRHEALWGALMGGAAGAEWYFGYKNPHSDLTCQDWRSRDQFWDYNKHALDFFNEHLPFWEMEPDNELASNENAFCFAKEGEIYAVYLPYGKSTKLDLSAGNYEVKWYNPRTGGELQNGSVQELNGEAGADLGMPPLEDNQDWVALVKIKN
ncbi:DUF5060 domain-containing protein [Flexithrix dorotheae]|uniref:DUF5060 domain-containing protein n=1 Tax=Flexithrix dorotheae TaxID=70993 RepID=UPI00146BAF81|nr:DUF5060 domain-containing protein [Flexithrix dorotheae]